MNDRGEPGQETEAERFVRLPGLLRRWEIPEVLQTGCVLHVEEAGEADDGTPLYAVYRAQPDGDVVP